MPTDPDAIRARLHAYRRTDAMLGATISRTGTVELTAWQEFENHAPADIAALLARVEELEGELLRTRLEDSKHANDVMVPLDEYDAWQRQLADMRETLENASQYLGPNDGFAGVQQDLNHVKAQALDCLARWPQDTTTDAYPTIH